MNRTLLRVIVFFGIWSMLEVLLWSVALSAMLIVEAAAHVRAHFALPAPGVIAAAVLGATVAVILTIAAGQAKLIE